MENTVNVKFYEFLKSNETKLFKINGKVNAYVLVNFCDLNKFYKISNGYYDDGGEEVTMCSGYLAINILEIIEDWFGHELQSYRDCFDKDDWESVMEV